MIKSLDFWEYLCNTLNYRFFAGTPCLGLMPLYNKMSSEFMHYIPAASEDIAVGLVNGALLAGTKSAVIMEADHINKLNLDFNINNDFPLFIIGYSLERPKLKQGIYVLVLDENLSRCLDKIDKHLLSKRKPCVLLIGEGILQ
jgi:sulfopyruvate decarboxylase TPP-binding subunit